MRVLISLKLNLLQDSLMKKKVKSNFKLLKRIDGTVKFASACCSLLTFADKVYPFINQIIPWFQSLI